MVYRKSEVLTMLTLKRIGLSILLLLSSVSVLLAQEKKDLNTGQQVLAGTDWKLVSMGRVGADTSVTGNPITLKFGNDGRISGSGGCNSFGGPFSVEGDRIKFGQVFSTRRACIDEKGNKQESAYLAALQSASRFRMTDHQLSIYYDGGRSLLEFRNEKPEGANDSPSQDDPIESLNSYYAAINEKNYERAYQYWEANSQTLEQFRRGFSDTAIVRLLVDPAPQIEGAAGSSYANISTILVSRRSNGIERIFAGCYVMRKSNLSREDNPSQRGWRIYRASIQAMPPNSKAAFSSQLCRDNY